jgi:hypothetical protein
MIENVTIDKTCIEEGCTNQWLVRRLCHKHYQYRRKHNKPLPPILRRVYKGNPCSIKDCPNEARNAGMICSAHCNRRYRGMPGWDTRPLVQRKRHAEPYGRDNAWEYHLHRTFGLPRGEYGRMLEAQGGVCAICEQPDRNRRLGVDHDHKTGKIRGLLCSSCNTSIGKFGENIDRLLGAVIYLISHQEASSGTTDAHERPGTGTAPPRILPAAQANPP